MHSMELWHFLAEALIQGHPLAFAAALTTLAWEAQDQHEQTYAILALIMVTALHTVVGLLLADAQCWDAATANFATGGHVGASAVARGTSGKGWCSRYRWRWNLRSMVGVALSWVAVARCLGVH